MRLDDENETYAPDERSLALPLEGLRILLVDDEEEVTDLYAHALVREGASVHTTLDGEQGLSALRAEPFDVVISDLDMPRLDGIEMVRSIRAETAVPTASVPAIAISGSVRPDVVQAALRAGFDAFATKPVRPRALIDAIVRLLERRSRTRGR